MPRISAVIPRRRSGISPDAGTAWASATVLGMISRLRDPLAIGITLVALVLGAGTLAIGTYDAGIRLGVDEQGRVIVRDVGTDSIASRSGIRAGMIVTQMSGVELIRLPQFVYPEIEPTPDPVTGETPPFEPIGLEPAEPTVLPIDPALRDALIVEPVFELSAIHPADLEEGVGDEWPVMSMYDDGLTRFRETFPSLALGVALLMLVGWWLGSGRAGESLRQLAIPLAAATAVPFLIRPLAASGVPLVVAFGGVVTVLAMVPARGRAHRAHQPGRGTTAGDADRRRLHDRRRRSSPSRSRVGRPGSGRVSRGGPWSGRSRSSRAWPPRVPSSPAGGEAPRRPADGSSSRPSTRSSASRRSWHSRPTWRRT